MIDIPVGPWVERTVDFLNENFAWLFDGVAAVLLFLIEVLVDVPTGQDAPLNLLNRPYPVVMVAILAVLALLTIRRWQQVLALTLLLLLVLSMDLWVATMETLAAVLVASAIAVLIGIPVGIWAARSNRLRALVRPVLDFMQTLPVFVYLLPAIFFFGIGVVPGVVATTVFAIPPAVRLTDLGIRQVDAEVVEAAAAFGSRPRQILREVQLPLALPSIMAGVNQVIMLALSMVVIGGMIGGGGLGELVYTAVTQVNVGDGFESGLAVVILAIYLDRVTAALGERTPSQGGVSRWRRLRGARVRTRGSGADATVPVGATADDGT